MGIRPRSPGSAPKRCGFCHNFKTRVYTSKRRGIHKASWKWGGGGREFVFISHHNWIPPADFPTSTALFSGPSPPLRCFQSFLHVLRVLHVEAFGASGLRPTMFQLVETISDKADKYTNRLLTDSCNSAPSQTQYYYKTQCTVLELPPPAC